MSDRPTAAHSRIAANPRSDDDGERATQFVLKLSCMNRPGIVASVSREIFENGWNIRESHQFDDTQTGKFFMRVAFDRARDRADIETLRERFGAIGADFAMDWTLRRYANRRRVLVLVSRAHHCLADLVYRWRLGELPMEFAGVVSNHPAAAFTHVDLNGIGFHHLPVMDGDKGGQEARLRAIIASTGAELVVLARYMQILSDALVTELAGRCINIHHSFLPGFKGARPYEQAFTRGVKLVGATAHYVTAELDEGPIIEQDVERISHGDTPETLVRKGRDIERRVLAQAIRYHLEDRVLLNGRKTVVFAD